MDDEIKLAGLEALVPEELEKHLILNTNRLRTFKDARLEIVTHVEAKFGLRVRDSKPSDTGSREHSDPLDVDAASSLSRLAKEKGHRVRVMGVVSAVEHIFNETDMHARAQTSNRTAKANTASHGPRVSPHSQAQARVKKTMENPKEPKARTKDPKVPKAQARAKTSKAGPSGLANSKSEASSDIQESAQTCTTDTSWNDGRNCDEWNGGWSFDEME